MKALDKLTVPNAAAWASWLLENASTSKGVSLVLAKKGTQEPTSLSQDQAVEEALCHGWINGQGNSIDEKTYMQRFTPRTTNSVWSKRNVGFVERLEKQGRMQDAGRAAVESAKIDGRWERAYSGAANLDEMQDLLDAIKASPSATVAWDGVGKGERSRVYFRLSALKTKSGRERHISEYVKKLESGGQAGMPPSSTSPVSRSRKRASSESNGDKVEISAAQPAKARRTRSGREIRQPVQ